MEQNLQRFLGIHTESQQSSAITEQPIQIVNPNLCYFPIINTDGGQCLPSHLLGGNLTPYQWIHPSPQQHSSPEPSGLPPQGW